MSPATDKWIPAFAGIYISVQAERAPCTLKCSVGVAARIDAAPVEHAGISL
jgi:hypothetical protein